MYSERFDEALVFAHQLHRRQRRKTSGAPYISHLLAVASLVMDDGGSEDEAIAALLHDSIEDQAQYYSGGRAQLAADIGRRFGPEVLRIVETCTERAEPRPPDAAAVREQWRAHKVAWAERISTADISIRRVACADSLHNVRSLIRDYRRLGEELWARFRTRSREDQLWGHHLIARALIEAGTGGMAEELLGAVEELRRVTELPAGGPSGTVTAL